MNRKINVFLFLSLSLVALLSAQSCVGPRSNDLIQTGNYFMIAGIIEISNPLVISTAK